MYGYGFIGAPVAVLVGGQLENNEARDGFDTFSQTKISEKVSLEVLTENINNTDMGHFISAVRMYKHISFPQASDQFLAYLDGLFYLVPTATLESGLVRPMVAYVPFEALTPPVGEC